MSYATALRCRECHREYPLAAQHVCEFCFGPVEVTYDYDRIRRNVTRESIERGPASLWRYRDFLPVDADAAIDIGAGYTPLIRAKNLGKALGLNNLYIKNDTVNPTWSFKAGWWPSQAARELGFQKLACASQASREQRQRAHAARRAWRRGLHPEPGTGKVLGSLIWPTRW
jgi:threonine synthase